MKANEFIVEYKTSPKYLIQLANLIPAKVGLEMEMVFPITLEEISGTSDDISYDSVADNFEQIVDFFLQNNANSKQSINMLFLNQAEKSYKEYLKDLANNELYKGDNDRELAEDYADRDRFDSDEKYEEYIQFLLAGKSSGFNNYLTEWIKSWVREHENDYQEDWLKENNFHYLSKIADESGLDWPFKLKTAEKNLEKLEDLAGEYSRIIDAPVNFSDTYHSGVRNGNSYLIEPDTSIKPLLRDTDNYIGLEFISPPLSFEKAVRDLKYTQDWALNYDAYTNSSTGLHINISLPNLDKLDYLKLVLFSGDQYILDTFDRGISEYLSPALDKVIKIFKKDPDIAEKFMDAAKHNITNYATSLVIQNYFNKFDRYTSINIRNNKYIEFRSPGHDWLDVDIDTLMSTIARYIVALDIACNENKYRNEYLKKLYLLIKKIVPDKKHESFSELYSQFIAGKISKQQLTDMLNRK